MLKTKNDLKRYFINFNPKLFFIPQPINMYP